MIFQIIAPLNIEEIFLNYFAGTALIFILLLIAFFAYVGAKLRIPTYVFLMLMAVLLAAFSYTRYQILMLLVLIFATLYLAYGLYKLTRSQ